MPPHTPMLIVTSLCQESLRCTIYLKALRNFTAWWFCTYHFLSWSVLPIQSLFKVPFHAVIIFGFFFFLRVLFVVILDYVHGFDSVCAHACGTHSSQKRASENLESELQVVVSHQMWVLGTEIRSSVRAIINLNSRLNCSGAYPPLLSHASM